MAAGGRAYILVALFLLTAVALVAGESSFIIIIII